MSEPRVDKRINVWKVAEVLAENPNKTIREIAEETDLSVGAAYSSKKEVEKTWTKDPTIAYIVGWAKERLKRIDKILNRFIDESESKEELNRLDTMLIKDIARDDLQRITVLWWDVTDDKWWLKAQVVQLPQRWTIDTDQE